MISFLIGLVVVLATLYVALIYYSAAIGLLAFAEAMILVAAFCYLQVMLFGIKCYPRIPIAVAEQKESVSVQIMVENRFLFSHQKIRFLFATGTMLQKRRKRFWETGGAVYKGRTLLQSSLYLEYAGTYTVELVKVRIYDKTGLFYLQKRIRKSASVQVLPKVIDVGVRICEQTRNFYGDSDVYDDFRPGHDKNEIFDVREFRDGDKIQSIHWKLSAKADDLVVREDSLPRACPVVLLLELNKPLSVLETDAYLQTAASIVFSLMDVSCPHYVAWYSGNRDDVVRVRVDEEEDYFIFLSHYLNEASSTESDIQKLYQEKYRYENRLHVLKLAADLSICLDGDRLCVLDPKDLKKSLQNLELTI